MAPYIKFRPLTAIIKLIKGKNSNVSRLQIGAGEDRESKYTMPTFNIFVTTPKSEIPGGFLLEASKFLASQLGKPESYVTVRVVPDQMMCHGGSTDPCGSLQVFSLGALGGELNKNHSLAIGEFIEARLKIPKDRFYITFFDIARSDCGYKGSTFA